VRIDPHHARCLRGAEPDGENRSQRDRHLAEDVAHIADAQHAVDAIDGPDGLDATLEHREQGALSALLRRILPR
jgi:hypothetical protein